MGIAFQHRADKVGDQLRSLLLARAEGSVNEEEFQQRQASLHAALLESKPYVNRKGWAWGVLGIIIAAIGIYTWLEIPNPKNAESAEPAAPMDTHIGPSALTETKAGGDLNVMAKRLADKLVKNPGDGQGWLLLARTYREINQMKEASSAYAKAAALLPPNADLLADWATTYVAANNGKWNAEAKKIVQRALNIDPKNLKSLSLAGSEAFSSGDYKAAIAHWKRMLTVADAGSSDAKFAIANIEEAEARLSGKATAGSTAQSPTAVAGTVTLDTKFRAQVAPTDTLFIVARAPDGSNPPLAVKRFTVANLPVHFKLDDSAAMLPSRVLSQYKEVTLIARISKSGQAAPATGDIETLPVTAKLGSDEIKLNLSVVR